jgi:hypothetical protein
MLLPAFSCDFALIHLRLITCMNLVVVCAALLERHVAMALGTNSIEKFDN